MLGGASSASEQTETAPTPTGSLLQQLKACLFPSLLSCRVSRLKVIKQLGEPAALRPVPVTGCIQHRHFAVVCPWVKEAVRGSGNSSRSSVCRSYCRQNCYHSHSVTEFAKIATVAKLYIVNVKREGMVKVVVVPGQRLLGRGGWRHVSSCRLCRHFPVIICSCFFL